MAKNDGFELARGWRTRDTEFSKISHFLQILRNFANFVHSPTIGFLKFAGARTPILALDPGAT